VGLLYSAPANVAQTRRACGDDCASQEFRPRCLKKVTSSGKTNALHQDMRIAQSCEDPKLGILQRVRSVKPWNRMQLSRLWKRTAWSCGLTKFDQ
jgi:hypothetical protein